MTLEEPDLETLMEPRDFTDFIAAQHGISRDAVQGLLGEWLLHYRPTLLALRAAENQAAAPPTERAGTTSAA